MAKHANPHSGHSTRVARLQFLMALVIEVDVVLRMSKALNERRREFVLSKFRIVVRTVHVSVESLLFFMKLDALHAHHSGWVEFSASDLKKLSEVNKKPDGTLVPVKLTFIQNAKCAIRCYSASVGGNSPEAQELIQLLDRFRKWPEMRNRVTHPKQLSDFEFKHSDLDLLDKIVAWFQLLSQWILRVERERVDGTYSDRVLLLEEMGKNLSSDEIAKERMKELLGKLMDTQNV